MYGLASDHPYAPREMKLPGYVPISLPYSLILGVYGRSPRLSRAERGIMCWWAFTGLTHIIMEGYFAFTPDYYKKMPATYLSDAWKEYSKSDSRYPARNSAVVALEGITAVLAGPASLLSVDILQLVTCTAQNYGTLMYFLTAFLDGDNLASSRFYYWAYYVGLNSPWLVIPPLITVRSWNKMLQLHPQPKSKNMPPYPVPWDEAHQNS
ncbi:putative 3-beta-hydroxysteroid-Delta(8) delta(7)-isomerase [Nymphaea thermarum]|nr:putative 3-beta-hydroxysteroid-Delta(8) delta(7)-isomerase [Nymphaea thermarum]